MKSAERRDPLLEVSWDGQYGGWADYVRRVRLAWERTEKKKRSLLGPDLVSRLKGKAWEAAVEVDHEPLCRRTGARYLLRFLEERLLKTAIPDLGLRLEAFFIRLHRQAGTSMAAWATQVREAYKSLCRSLMKVKATTGQVAKLTDKNLEKLNQDQTPSRRSDRGTGSRQPRRRRSDAEPEPQHESTPTILKDGDEELLPEAPLPEARDGSWKSKGSKWSAKDWERWQKGRWTWDEEDPGDSESESSIAWEEFQVEQQEIVPDEILGWLLLRRSGLSSTSRLAIQASIQNELSFHKVERALRDQEEELLLTEKGGRSPNARHPEAKRRTFWVEEDGVWGILADTDEPLDLDENQIQWCQFEEEPEPEDVWWTQSPSGQDLSWTLWDG